MLVCLFLFGLSCFLSLWWVSPPFFFSFLCVCVCVLRFLVVALHEATPCRLLLLVIGCGWAVFVCVLVHVMSRLCSPPHHLSLFTHSPPPHRYGPIFYEAFRFEERTRHDKRAVRVVQRGTREISRYGPLWFGAFRIFEKLDTQSFMAAAVRARHAGRPVFPPHQPGDWLHDTRAAVAAAVTCISKELVWKVYFKQAEMEARAAQLATAVAAPWPWAPDAPPPPDAHRAAEVAEVCLRCARAAYARSARHCQENLRWKVWLSGARMELAAGHEDVARALVARAEARVSHKSRSQVLLELVRLEEYCGNVDRAREMLALSRQTLGHQWKVFLESVLLERRAGNRRAAVRCMVCLFFFVVLCFLCFLCCVGWTCDWKVGRVYHP